MAEEAERQFQQSKLQADSIVQTDQPETVVSSSFANFNFEMEEDWSNYGKQTKSSLCPTIEGNDHKMLNPKLSFIRKFLHSLIVGFKTIIYILNY